MLGIKFRLFHNYDFKDVIISIQESTADLITSLSLSVENIPLFVGSYKNFSLIHITMAPGLATEDGTHLSGKLNYA